MMDMAIWLIETGLRLGVVKPDYKLVGHNQVELTDCPGGALANEIKNWPNWVPMKAGGATLALNHWLLGHIVVTAVIVQSMKLWAS